MPEPIILADARKQMQREYQHLRQWRAELIWTLPIADKRITTLDAQLVDHPLTDTHLLHEIMARAMYLTWLEYDLFGVETKHRALVSLREVFRAIQKLPQPYQDAFAPMWFCWLQTFKEEEEATYA